MDALSGSHPIDPQSLAALPRTSGVYIFRGDGTLPLYIGKSVDIRARVLSHLRAADEARMVAQTRRVDFIETAGELGALLLESQMVKAHSPLFNIRLRRLRHLHALRLEASGTGLRPVVVNSKETDIGRVEGLYGLFGSRHAAQEKLRELARTHSLCLALLGLEKATARGCFGVQIKACRGGCVGLEDRASHDERLFLALKAMQVHAWPHAGAIELVETRGDWVQKHRVQDWRYLGTWCSRVSGLSWGEAETAFDLDTYRILVGPVMARLAGVEARAPVDS